MLHNNVIEQKTGFRALDIAEMEAVAGGELGGPGGELHKDALPSQLQEQELDGPSSWMFGLVPTGGAIVAVGWVDNQPGGAYIDQNTAYFVDADGQVWRDFEACVQSGTQDIQDERASIGNNLLGPVGQIIDLIGGGFGYEYPEQTENQDRTKAANHCANG